MEIKASMWPLVTERADLPSSVHRLGRGAGRPRHAWARDMIELDQVPRGRWTHPSPARIAWKARRHMQEHIPCLYSLHAWLETSQVSQHMHISIRSILGTVSNFDSKERWLYMPLHPDDRWIQRGFDGWSVVRTRTTTGSFPDRQIGAGAGDDVGLTRHVPDDRNYASLSTFYTLESVQLALSIELASLKLKLRGGDLFAVLHPLPPFFPSGTAWLSFLSGWMGLS
jgi:hypothetical protein